MKRPAAKADTLSIYLSLIAGLVLAVAAIGAALLEPETPPEKHPRATKQQTKALQAVKKGDNPAIAAIQLPPPPHLIRKAKATKPNVAITPMRIDRPAEKSTPIEPLKARRDTAAPRKVEKVRPLRPTPPPKSAALHVKPAPAVLPPKPNNTVGPEEESANIVDAQKSRTAGRSLLRLLEHGTGPAIEIAWPNSSLDRYKLYLHLTRCAGMQLALLDSGNRLFRQEGPAGQSWNIDGDTYSGFLRSPAGAPVAAEAATFSAIAARHRLTDWQAVRVFPRNVDAILLGGLEQLVGARYREAKTIHAAYRLEKGRLSLDTVTVDGRRIPGAIKLSAACRGRPVS